MQWKGWGAGGGNLTFGPGIPESLPRFTAYCRLLPPLAAFLENREEPPDQIQPALGLKRVLDLTQGSDDVATMGWKMESRWLAWLTLVRIGSH